MTGKPTAESERQDRLNCVLLEYLEEIRAGRFPDHARLVAMHPELQDDIEEFAAGYDEVARMVEPLLPVPAAGDSSKVGGDTESYSADEPAVIGRFADFRLFREVGRGGMGVVYEAEQVSLRRRVALKVLPRAAAIDARQLKRFRNEAVTAAHLQHDHIVPVYAVGDEGGIYYYAMRFIDGRSLAELIDDLRKLAGKAPSERDTHLEGPVAKETTESLGITRHSAPKSRGPDSILDSISRDRSTRSRSYFDWVARLGHQAGLALEHAHHHGIVHRDIKPGNLLLDQQEQLWIADFGVAQFSSKPGVTCTGEIVGTLRYASPEQALGKRGLIDHRSDIYSLGATLYELLTLEPVFASQGRQELLEQIAREEPINPRSNEPSIPVDLETIVLKAMAKEPIERYASAQALANDLENFRENRPIEARRPSATERVAKWMRRHRALVASVALAFFLALCGTSLAVVLIGQAYSLERQRSKEAEDRFLLARQLADEMIDIAEENTEESSQLMRRRLLETAASHYQDFVRIRRGSRFGQDDLESTQKRVESILADLAILREARRHGLLSNPDVQADLRVSAKQAEQLELIFREIDANKPPPRSGFSRTDKPDEATSLLSEMKAHEARLAEILTNKQLTRLSQISLQERGVHALLETDVVAVLGLSRVQRAEIRSSVAALQPDPAPGPRPGPGPGFRGGRERGPGGDDGPPPFPGEQSRGAQSGLPPGPPPFGRDRPPSGLDDGPPPRRDQHSEQDMQPALAVLTPEQLARWHDLTGPPFVATAFSLNGPHRHERP